MKSKIQSQTATVKVNYTLPKTKLFINLDFKGWSKTCYSHMT